MSQTIPQNTLVVVADGHQSRLFRTRGTGDAFSLDEGPRLTPKQLSDGGPSGSRPEEQTPKQTDEATFAKQQAERLHGMMQAGEFEHMILAADPQTLGQLSDTMDPTLSTSIFLTLNKELINHAAADIAKIVRQGSS